MSDEDKPASYEDLLEYALSLEKQIDEKDAEIAELSKSQIGRGRGRRGGNDEELVALQLELKELQDKSDTDVREIKKLKEDLATASAKLTSSNEEKADLDRKNRALSKKIEEIENENRELHKKTQQVESKSREFNKQKSVNIKMSQQLTDENETLKEEMSEMSSTIRQLQQDKQQLEEVLAKFSEDRDRVESDRNNLDVEKQELLERIAELENDFDEIAEKLEASMAQESDWEVKNRNLQQELLTVQAQASKELAGAKSETEALKRQVNSLKESTQLGQVQRSLDSLQLTHSQQEQIVKDLQSQLQATLQERDILSAELLDIENDIDSRVATQIAKERLQVKALEAQLQREQEDREKDAEHYASLEKERESLSKDVDELMNWKAVYEAGHGLQQLARTQKKLSDDNRRLTKALEEQSLKVSALVDSHSCLSVAFDRLKRETGKPSDFFYDDLELHNEVKALHSSLQAQVRELESQLHGLETENSRLRRAMRDSAGAMSSKGFAFAGLTADQIVSVNDFAAGLQNGHTVLPLDDRSRELQKEVQRLKSELQSSAPKSSQLMLTDGNAEGVLTDAFGADIHQLVTDHAKLQSEMRDLRAQLDALLSQQGESGTINSDELAKILSHNNALVLREIEQLRRQQGSLHVEESDASLPPQQPPQQLDLPPTGKSTRRPFSATTQSQVGQKQSLSLLDLTPTRPTTGGAFSQTGQFWTPDMRGGRMPFAQSTMQTMQTPRSLTHSLMQRTPFSARGERLNGVSTPAGKQLLAQSLSMMSLPPEEWASDVKDVHAQLVEVLEQLFERENELQETHQVVETFEKSLAELRFQSLTLFSDAARERVRHREREEQLLNESRRVTEENEDLRLRLRRSQEMLDRSDTNDDSLQSTVTELRRKVVIYEVNEAVLTRKFRSLTEQLEGQEQKNKSLQTDFVEMERSLKERLLIVEHHKQRFRAQNGRLAMRLSQSVPQSDYLGMMRELDALREAHIVALQREVEARERAIRCEESERETRALRIVLSHAQSESERIKASLALSQQLLDEERDRQQQTLLSLQNAGTVSETAKLISELARFRGECGRLEVEFAASERKVAALATDLQRICAELEAESARCLTLTEREKASNQREAAAREALLQMRLQFECGATRDEKEQLVMQCESLKTRAEAAESERDRHKQLAEISAQQVQSLQQFRDTSRDEVRQLREHCARLESAGDDELIIGRLHRQLVSTQASYKMFVRKYAFSRETLRKREIECRVLEHSLTQREGDSEQHEQRARRDVAAMRRALLSLRDSFVELDLSKPKASAADSKEAKIASRRVASAGLGERLAVLSDEVERLTALAEGSAAIASQRDDELRQVKAQCDDAVAERDILASRLRDLETLLNVDGPGRKSSSSKGEQVEASKRATALRLIALSDELRAAKLSGLQRSREAQRLRDELLHAKHATQRLERQLLESERERVDADLVRAKSIALMGSSNGQRSTASLVVDADYESEGEVDRLLNETNGDMDLIPNARQSSASAQVRALTGDPLLDESEMEVEQAQKDKERLALMEELRSARKDFEKAQLAYSQSESRERELRGSIEEQEALLRMYETVLREQGLGDLVVRAQQRRELEKENPHGNASPSQGMAHLPAQEKLQEAASATIGSLRSLLEEKNRLLESYREKLSALQSAGDRERDKSKAEQRADALLDALHAKDERLWRETLHNNASMSGRDGESIEKKSAVLTALQETNERLNDQLKEADELIREKDALLRDIEQKLSNQNYQRERAEMRCGEALKEISAMQEDMQKLFEELQASEARCAHLTAAKTVLVNGESLPEEEANSKRRAEEEQQMKEQRELLISTQQQLAEKDREVRKLHRKVLESEKSSKSKDEKVRGYREIVVRLKEEFVKAEEEKAAQVVRTKFEREARDSSSGVVSTEELRELKQKIAELHDGLRNAKLDLDKAKKARDKIATEKEQAVNALQKADEKEGKLEKERDSAQNLLQKTRRELEESKRKETRLREKLKEFLKAQGEATDAKKEKEQSTGRHSEKIEVLEREVALLRAQNAALRRPDSEPRFKELDEDSHNAHARAHSEERAKSAGAVDGDTHILGGGVGPVDDLRQQLHNRWEGDKKSQKRIQTLEARLKEVAEENDELRRTVLRLKENASNSATVREELQKRVKDKSAETADANKAKRFGAIEWTDLSEAHEKVFALEQQIQTLRRRLEVDKENQVRALERKLSQSADRITQLERELNEVAEKSNKYYSAQRGTRDSENQFLREEKLRDDVDSLRRAKLSLESTILERDAQTLEQRFELESAQVDVQRMRRRVSELESVNTALRNIVNSGGGAVATGALAAGGGLTGTNMGSGGPSQSRRETELEATLEAMRRLVEKLKGENDRLRKDGGTDDGRTAHRGASSATVADPTSSSGDKDKRALQAERKKNERLAAELATAQIKAKLADDLQQKLASRAQQLSSLRQSLKLKEDELKRAADDINALQQRVAVLESAPRGGAHEPVGSRGGVDVADKDKEKALDELRKQLSISTAENDLLKADVAELRRRIQSTLSQSIGADSKSALNEEVSRLKGENEKLKQELSAFDLDFFEEIENLKFAHAQAMRKLKMYEQQMR